MADRGCYQGFVQDAQGNIVPNAVLNVYKDISGTPLASISSDRQGATPIAQPWAADDNGFFQFFAAGGPYKIVANDGDDDIATLRYVPVGTAAEHDWEEVLAAAVAGIGLEQQWLTATAYVAKDVVYNKGSSFFCILAHTSGSTTEPGLGSSWSTNWVRMVTGIIGRDAWVTATKYQVGALVYNGGSSYYCYTEHTSGALTEPGVGANWTNDWYLVAVKGSAGVAGPTGSTSFNFDNATSDAGIGNGEFRLNSGTIASVTKIWADNLNRGGESVASWLDSFDDVGVSARRGNLELYSAANPHTIFAIFSVTGSIVDKTGYREVTVAWINGPGGFTNGEEILWGFYPGGPAGSGLADVVDDTTPQLGGALDANGFNIGMDNGTGITDDSGNEQLLFAKTASAVNEMTHTNAATGNAPSLKATGGDTNIDQEFAGKGTGGSKFTTQPFCPAQSLTDGATINWNVNTQPSAKVTLGGNRTMAAPTNMKDGATYILKVVQDGTGSRTLTWNSVFKWPGGVAPTLSTAAGAIDIFTFYTDGTNLYGAGAFAFA